LTVLIYLNYRDRPSLGYPHEQGTQSAVTSGLTASSSGNPHFDEGFGDFGSILNPLYGFGNDSPKFLGLSDRNFDLELSFMDDGVEAAAARSLQSTAAAEVDLNFPHNAASMYPEVAASVTSACLSSPDSRKAERCIDKENSPYHQSVPTNIFEV
jgi:hypothetical protein